MGSRPFPDDLVDEVLRPKDSVQQHLEVVARGRVAMEPQGAGGLQDAM